MSRIIEVKPIQRQKWHELPPEKDFARPFVLEALLDANTHKYATGLSAEDKERLEKATGYDLSDTFDPLNPHVFWSNAVSRVRLESRTNLFDISIPINEIKYHIMKASKFVANSQTELEKGLYPDAKFVIYDKEEETAVRAKALEIKSQVHKLIEGMQAKQKADVVQIATGMSMSNQSNDYITVELDNLIAKLGYPKLLTLLQKDTKRNSVQATIMTACDKRILNKKGDMFFYFDEMLGDIEGAIDYLLDPKNQTIKMQILEKLNVS
jgi:hypothetical protein